MIPAVGRARDELIAQRLGGAEVLPFVCPRCGGGFFNGYTAGERRCLDQFNRGCRWAGPSVLGIPPFSTSDAQALALLQRWVKLGDAAWERAYSIWGTYPDRVVVTLDSYETGTHSADASTLADAATQAFLLEQPS